MTVSQSRAQASGEPVFYLLCVSYHKKKNMPTLTSEGRWETYSQLYFPISMQAGSVHPKAIQICGAYTLFWLFAGVLFAIVLFDIIVIWHTELLQPLRLIWPQVIVLLVPSDIRSCNIAGKFPWKALHSRINGFPRRKTNSSLAAD